MHICQMIERIDKTVIGQIYFVFGLTQLVV